MLNYDVIIIGGGSIGTSLAMEISKYRLSVALLESRADIARSTTGANSGIVHAGFDAPYGSEMARFNVEGNKIYRDICSKLHIPFKQTGSYVLAFTPEDQKTLQHLLEQGTKNGVEGLEIVNREQLIQKLPHTKDSEVIEALYAPTAGIVSPYEAAIAFAEVAIANGAHIYLEHTVTKIDGNNITVSCPEGKECKTTEFSGRIIVNCAGLSAPDINRMAGAEEYDMTFRKGEYILYDRIYGQFAQSVIFQPPTKAGKGVLVTPTAEGNLLIGPSSDPVNDTSTDTTAQGLDYILQTAKKSCPDLPVKDSITTFAGIRAVSGKDFIIERSAKVKDFYYTIGICSPGLTSAPAIALHLCDMILEDMRSKGDKSGPCMKDDVVTTRECPLDFSELSWEERKEAIKIDPLYGRIICRCETVTEAEIIHAIRSAAKYKFARPTPEWVKRRCRAGLGRCQGSFCRIYVEELIKKYSGGNVK